MQGFSSRHPEVEQSFQSFMTGSLAGKVLTLALEQPTFFKSAPILYPRKLMALIGDKEEEQDETKKSLQATLLKTLEDIAVESPWMFGFSDVMFNKTKIKSTVWYQDISLLHQAVLYTYDLFKRTCSDMAHIFLREVGIIKHVNYYGNSENHDYMKAIDFLIENQVVRRQWASGARFHLMRFWKAEHL